MTYLGHVKNGLIALDDAVTLPEGSAVKVELVSAKVSGVAENTESDPSESTVWDRLRKFAGTAEGLPPDLAENHDHYLYGLPKRKP